MPQDHSENGHNDELVEMIVEEQLDDDIDLEAYELDYPEVPFEESLDAIQAEALAPNDLLGFSNMSRKNVHQLRAVWHDLPDETRATIAEVALMVAREHPFSDFGRFFQVVLEDESEEVRVTAATGAALSDIPELIKPLHELAGSDSSVIVREAAINALIPHVVGLDYGLMSDHKDVDRLLELKAWAHDESQPAEIRAAALHAYSHNTADDDVDDIIKSFVLADDDNLQLGAMRAMAAYGAGAFTSFLETQLQSNDIDVREAAVTAMGSSGDQAVVPMITMAARSDQEIAVREAAYTALANNASDAALKALQELLKHAADDEIESIESAIMYITELNELEAEVGMLEDFEDDEDDY